MKKVFLFLTAIFLVAVLMPVNSQAQAKFELPATIALDVYDVGGDASDHVVIHKEGRVLITPSGNLQLKIGFDLNGFPGLVPTGEEQKITVARLAVRVYLMKDVDNDAEASIHFEETDVNGTIYPDGMAYFVVNWRGIDQILGW